MAGQPRNKEEKSRQREGKPIDPEEITGSPGRTPGTAEGDRETAEASLREGEGPGEQQGTPTPLSSLEQTGDPGRTPGTAEGDRETAEASRDEEGEKEPG